MGEPQHWGEGVTGTGIGVAAWNHTALVTDWSGGRLLAFTDGVLEDWGDGYSEPEGVAVLNDTEALIVERTGTLLRQDLLLPGRGGATVLASGLGSPHGVVVGNDGATAFVTDHAGGRIIAVSLADGTTNVVQSGLSNPVGIVQGPTEEFYVTEQGLARVARIAPDGSVSPVVTGLTSPFLLSWSDAQRTGLLVTERTPAHRVSIVQLSTSTVTPLVRWGIRQPSQALVIDERLVVAGANRVLALALGRGLEPGAWLHVPQGPLWPGSWVDAPVDLGLTGLSAGEVDVVSESPELVQVNRHPSEAGDPARPTVRLLAGARPGQARMVVRVKSTGEELGAAQVTVDIPSTPSPDGPALFVERAASAPVVRTLSGGIDDAGRLRPRDRNDEPLDSWGVLAVLVDTGDEEWPTTVTNPADGPTTAQAQAAWATVFTGAQGVDAFIREMSVGAIGRGVGLGVDLVSGGVMGPVHLGGVWGDWFTMSGTQWVANAEVLERVVWNLGTTVNWDDVDTVLMIVRSAGGNFVWARASIGRSRTVVVQAPPPFFFRPVDLAVVSMPHDQQTTIGFNDEATTTHELCHNLGLDDLYMLTGGVALPGFTTEIARRELGRLELMSNQRDLPHLSVRNKLLLGFVKPSEIRRFDVDRPETAVDVWLVPNVGGAPPPGQHRAVEVSAGPGRSWFFEYRAPAAGRFGDTGADIGTGLILGYDAQRYTAPPVVASARRPIILLADDDDTEGPTLLAGEDYEVLDPEGSDAPTWLRLEVLSLTPTLGHVLVTTGPAPRPDPTLVEAPFGSLVSESIRVANRITDGMTIGGLLENVPLAGITNRIITTVKNEGARDAPGVVVRTAVLPFNTDHPLSSRWDNKDPVTVSVPAGGTADAVVEWLPQVTGHYCVRSRLDYYGPPQQPLTELSIHNNDAQTNYDIFLSFTESPATRSTRLVQVHNPHPYPVQATVEVAQDSDAYRSYIDHRWLSLQPGEVRTVRLEVESKATDAWQPIEWYPDGRTLVRTWLPGPGCVDGTGTAAGGRTVTVVRTAARVGEEGDDSFVVQIEAPAVGLTAQSGEVRVRFILEDGTEEYSSAEVVNGYATVAVPAPSWKGQLYYSGGDGFAPIIGQEIHSTT
jgi:hypothetical protein